MTSSMRQTHKGSHTAIIGGGEPHFLLFLFVSIFRVIFDKKLKFAYNKREK